MIGWFDKRMQSQNPLPSSVVARIKGMLFHLRCISSAQTDVEYWQGLVLKLGSKAFLHSRELNVHHTATLCEILHTISGIWWTDVSVSRTCLQTRYKQVPEYTGYAKCDASSRNNRPSDACWYRYNTCNEAANATVPRPSKMSQRRTSLASCVSMYANDPVYEKMRRSLNFRNHSKST